MSCCLLVSHLGLVLYLLLLPFHPSSDQVYLNALCSLRLTFLFFVSFVFSFSLLGSKKKQKYINYQHCSSLSVLLLKLSHIVFSFHIKIKQLSTFNVIFFSLSRVVWPGQFAYVFSLYLRLFCIS